MFRRNKVLKDRLTINTYRNSGSNYKIYRFYKGFNVLLINTIYFQNKERCHNKLELKWSCLILLMFNSRNRFLSNKIDELCYEENFKVTFKGRNILLCL